MKTFTTYAEKKAKQFLNLLQGYTKGIRLTAILILLLMGVSNAWADINFSGGYIYFDNSIGINQKYIQLCARQSSWTGVSTMTNISNTKLYYVANPQGSGWGSILGWVVIGNSTTKTNSNFDNWTAYGWCSNWNEYGFNSGNTYLIVPTSTSKSQSVNTSYLSGGYSALNSQQTIKSAVNGADANSKATISITSYKMTGNGQVTEQTATLGTGAADTYVSAARTATTTLKVGDVATGYQFDGWYAAKTGGTALSTEKTYTYYPTAATTVYARFSIKKHTVLFGVHSSGHGSLTAKVGNTDISSNSKVNYGSTIVFTATPSAGYQIEGWYSNSDCTTPINNETNDTYTVTITGGTNVYVKYEEIPEEKFAVTIQPNNANYGTVSPSGLQQVGASGIDITATAKTGYQFDEWTCTIGASVEDASKPNTTASATAESTVTANFSIKNYTITYNLNGGTNTTSNPASYTVETETITLQDPTKEGFLFAGWYTSSTFNGTAVTSITKGSTGDKTYYAKWIDSRDCIFFYNNLGWSNVYVYFYNDAAGYNYWADGYGTGANKLQQFWENNPYWEMEHGTMTQIKGTNIWYYHATYIKTNKRSKVSFANVNQSYNQTATNENSFFQNAKVVYRADLDYEKRLPMFVPHTTQSHYFSNTKSTYYNDGYWMNYPENTGYKLHIFDENGNIINNQLVDIPFEYSDNTIMPWSVNVSLEGAKTYAFKIQRADNQWYGNNGTMTTNSSGDAGQTAWEFTTGTNNCKITTTAPGTYVFTLKYDKDRNSNYNYLVGVKYPASVGDYRLVYKDNTHPFHPGHLLKKRAGSDIVSFFVHYNENPLIMLQQVTNIDAKTGAITWGTLKTYALTANQPVGDNPGQAMISGRRNADEVILHIGDEHMDGVDATGIYNFVLEQTDSEATLQNTATKYTGNFYIRTNAAAGGWGNFRQNGNKMTYTSYADNQDFNFNHYFVKWINAGTNVKFTIANEYSYCLSDSLDADDIVTTGNLPADANVRFGWNSKTNEQTRAYIAGSSNASDRFLVLEGNDDLKDINGNALHVSGLNPNEAIFSDKQNWIYQLDVQANNNTEITLTAKYNNKVQTFFGTSKSGFGGEPIMQATNDDYHKVRMIYDFKTNNLIAAWLLDETQYPETKEVTSNMLIIREDQGDANQINFSNIDNDDMKIQTAYAVMTFTKEWVTGATTRDRSEYWVSFPFDVNLSDVFGFSEYGDQWIMLLYDGAGRAENGGWKETTYWKYITNRNYTLEAGVGYVLKLNPSKMESEAFAHGATDASLFFPSQGIPTVINAEPTPITVPAHPCTIERDNRNIYDSHWNLIGVPGYANLNNVNTKYTTGNQAENVSFYYAYNAAENNYAAAAATADFKNMYAYMVQFAGTIDWKNDPLFNNNIPQQLAARRNSDAEPEKRTLRLEIAQGEEIADQTFVQLQHEGATPEFDMNLDLTKIINSGANIYTLAGDARIQTAGNVLPMGECIVPVGVKIDAASEYTFRMPDGTEGMVVELIDYEENTKTNLLLSEYTTTLPKGTHESRFALSVKPDKVATSIENAGDEVISNEVKKYIINGKLFLQKDGILYNAQGHCVR